MSRSIAKRTLAIAKREETKRLKCIKEEFLQVVQKELERRENNGQIWTGDEELNLRAIGLKNFSVFDIKDVNQNIGFRIREDIYGTWISVPRLLVGEKRTKAQLMLYWHKINVNRYIKREKERARKACIEALEKIKNKEFETYGRGEGEYGIVVKVNPFKNSKVFEREVERILEKRNFYIIRLDSKENIWYLLVAEK